MPARSAATARPRRGTPTPALLHHVSGTLEHPGLADPDLTISNSTITANAAESIAQPSVAGGIEELSGWSTKLAFSTVSGNAADVGANVAIRPGLPDYPNSPSGGTVSNTASVFTDPQGGGSNCDAVTLSESAYAYVTDDSCGTTARPDPQLGALADNGGPTLTMLSAATSLLLDWVPTPDCLAHVTIDQRGIARPQGTACDIGAVEREAPPDPTPTPAGPLPGAAAADGPTATAAVVAEPRFTG
jgi:hypothetical protein